MRSTWKILNLCHCYSFGASPASCHGRAWCLQRLVVSGPSQDRGGFVVPVSPSAMPLSTVARRMGQEGKGWVRAQPGPIGYINVHPLNFSLKCKAEETTQPGVSWGLGFMLQMLEAFNLVEINTYCLHLLRRQIKRQIFQRACTQILCSVLT